MIRSIETTGKTKELAIRAALEQLKLTEDDITYEILELGRSGFLGIGAKPVAIPASNLDLMRDQDGTVHAVTSWTKDQLKDMPEHQH